MSLDNGSTDADSDSKVVNKVLKVLCTVTDPYSEESDKEPLPHSINAKFWSNMPGVKSVQFLIKIDEKNIQISQGREKKLLF